MVVKFFKIFYFDQKARYVYVCSSVRVFAACSPPDAPALGFNFLLSQLVSPLFHALQVCSMLRSSELPVSPGMSVCPGISLCPRMKICPQMKICPRMNVCPGTNVCPGMSVCPGISRCSGLSRFEI